MTWEYQVFSWSVQSGQSPKGVRQLNELGQQGWEAVGIMVSAVGYYTVLLKRRLS
jgi:hypothetical protein